MDPPADPLLRESKIGEKKQQKQNKLYTRGERARASFTVRATLRPLHSTLQDDLPH